MKKITLVLCICITSIIVLCIGITPLFADSVNDLAYHDEETELLEISVNDFYNLFTSNVSKAREIFDDSEKDTLHLIITDNVVDSEKFLYTINNNSFNRPTILDLSRVSSVTQDLEFKSIYANIKEVIFPDVYIPYKFDIAKRIEKVRIPKDQTVILMNQFESMNCLKEIEIPEGSMLSEIQSGAFYWTDNIEKITNLPPSCKELGYMVFQNKQKLKYIDLSNVEVIGKDAFNGCESLEELSLNEKLQEMNAFNGCKSLKRLTIRNPEMKFEDGAFSGINELEDINLPKNSYYIVKDGVLMDEDKTHIFFVLANSKNKTYRIPDSVKKIDEFAFSSNNGIKKIINIPDLENSFYNAFSGCKTLEEVKFRENVRCLGSSTFVNCESLKTIEFPKTVNRIGTHFFLNCKSLDNVILPEGLIPNSWTSDSKKTPKSLYALFKGCTSLKNITLPKDSTSIDVEMFENTGLEKISIPENVTVIASSAFRKCENLTEINLPKNITTIGSNAFEGCSKIKNIQLPQGLKTLGKEVFKDCSSLETLMLPESLTELSGSLIAGTNIKEINIPLSVKTIKRDFFKDTPSLKTVYYNGTCEKFKSIFDRQWLNGDDYLDINIVCIDKTFNLLELTKFYTAEELKDM